MRLIIHFNYLQTWVGERSGNACEIQHMLHHPYTVLMVIFLSTSAAENIGYQML